MLCKLRAVVESERAEKSVPLGSALLLVLTQVDGGWNLNPVHWDRNSLIESRAGRSLALHDSAKLQLAQGNWAQAGVGKSCCQGWEQIKDKSG